MIRHLVCYCFVGILALTAAHAVHAQDWARKMFQETSHNFGTVARGSKIEHVFELENKYVEDIHIKSVRSSCGCTTPRITKQTLKTWEKGQIVARYNTHSFLGKRGATITVVIDKPYYAEVQLRVDGYIRSDIVFEPGKVEFGEVGQGNGAQRSVNVNYSGRSSWQIVDVRSANPNLEVELGNPRRQFNRVNYDLLVRLKPETPAGYLQGELTLVTNDSRLMTVTLPFEGRVISPLSVSPPSLFFGNVEAGQKVTKKLVVRGNTPFKVLRVQCDEACFEVEQPDGLKKLHFIPVTFSAPVGEQGEIKKTIMIETDLGSGSVAKCVATATITPEVVPD